MSSTNGCILHVTGPELGAALKTLPTAGRESPASITTDIDTMMLGRVRLTYALHKSNMHRWATQYFWGTVHAEVLSTLSPDRPLAEQTYPAPLRTPSKYGYSNERILPSSASDQITEEAHLG